MGTLNQSSIFKEEGEVTKCQGGGGMRELGIDQVITQVCHDGDGPPASV